MIMTGKQELKCDMNDMAKYVALQVQPVIVRNCSAYFLPSLDVSNFKPRLYKNDDQTFVSLIQVKFDLSPPTPDPRHFATTAKTNDISIDSSANKAPAYIYESDTVRRLQQQQQQQQRRPDPVISVMGKKSQPIDDDRKEQIPYHARDDSKPFTYGLLAADAAQVVAARRLQMKVAEPESSPPPMDVADAKSQQQRSVAPTPVSKTPTKVAASPAASPAAATTTSPAVANGAAARVQTVSTPPPANSSGGVVLQPMATSSPRLEVRSQAANSDIGSAAAEENASHDSTR